MKVSRETRDRLDHYRKLVVDESASHNLVAASTLDAFETRHIADSLQLAALGQPGRWVDLGSGAGLPGIVLGILGQQVTLVESRRLRSEFLIHCVASLAIGDHVTVHAGRVETMSDMLFDNITARAFAPLAKLLPLAHRFSHRDTMWVLPKGRTASEELASVDGTWQGRFSTVPSATDPDAAIIVARDVMPRSRR